LPQSTRIPLNEAEFNDAAAARAYDEHARRFMSVVYRRLAGKAARTDIPGKQVLDIGTGSGLLAIELARARSDWRITGIDVSGEMLKLARQNASLAGVDGRVDIQPGSAAALPFPDKSFAMVTSNTSFRLWENPLTVFQEIARVIAPGGCCLVWDNLRLPVLRLFLGLVGRAMGMDSDQRRLWMRAIRSAYTLGETRSIIKESALKNARVSFVPRFLMLDVTWYKS
jgi:ubiquinone/menaquinone biosynthesis C-methylase UbiE